MHRNSLLLFEKYAVPRIKPGMRVLEIGGRTHNSVFMKLAADPGVRWETLDLGSGPGITWTARGEYEFPFEDGEFDAVFCANVIEHVRKVWTWVPELARVTKPGGLVITINPVNWPYHESPVDCWRIYPEGMRALYSDAGLAVDMSVSETLENKTARLLDPHGLGLKTIMDLRRRMFGKDAPLFAVDTITIGTKVS